MYILCNRFTIPMTTDVTLQAALPIRSPKIPIQIFLYQNRSGDHSDLSRTFSCTSMAYFESAFRLLQRPYIRETTHSILNL